MTDQTPSLNPSHVAALADQFIRDVDDYLSWDKLLNLSSATAMPVSPGSSAETDLVNRITDQADRVEQAAALIRKHGPVLAVGLERYGCDSTCVLFIVHCAGRNGGGAEYIWRKWEENKVALQRDALKLRTGTGGPEATERGETDSESHENKDSPQLKPCHASAKALYEWAIEQIDGAENMTYEQLFDALQSDARCAGEGLPDNAETFSRYCRAAGIHRNNTHAKPPTRSVCRASQV